jgi:hypothetical protein
MKRYLPFAASAFAVALAAAVPAVAGEGANDQHQHELIARDQASCGEMIKAFDMTRTTHAGALALRHSGEANCNEHDSFATSIGVQDLEQALAMIGIKVATPKASGETTFQYTE